MSLLATIETDFGESHPLYIKAVQLVVNEPFDRPASAQVLFYGYMSQKAKDDGRRAVWERAVEFTPDKTLPLWPQAYAALKAMPEMKDAVDL